MLSIQTSPFLAGHGGLRQSRGLCVRAPRVHRSVVHVRSSSEKFGAQVAVVLGTQWGDEGKGKLVDILAQQYDLVCRAQVGPMIWMI